MKKILCFVFTAALLLNITVGFAGVAQRTIFLEEDHVFLDLTAFQEGLYFLTDEGVFCLNTETGEQILITDTVSGDYKKDNCVDWLCANESGLYAVCLKTGTLLRILNEKAEENIQEELTFDIDEENYIISGILTGDWLCLLAEYDEETRLDFWPLGEGDTFSVPVENAFSICPGMNHTVLYGAVTYERGLAKYSVGRVDPDNEKEEMILETGEAFHNICEDQKGQIFLIANGMVYNWNDEEGKTVETAVIPGGDVVGTTLFADQMIAVIVDNCLAVKSLEEDTAGERVTLVVMEQYGRAEFYKNFITAHPEVEVQFVDSGEMTPEERFIQDMLVCDDSVDVYLLSDTNMLRTVRERGYYVDLSGIDAIRGRVNRMYDPFRNAFSRDGIVYAYPHDIFIASLTYHKSTFEKLGLTPPTTYEEYLDLCLTIQDDYEDQLMNVNIDPFVNGMDLRYLLTRYTDEQIRAGKTPVYQTGELERVLDKYLEVRETFENKEQFSADGVPLFYLYDLGALDDQSAQDYLPLTFEKDAQPLYAPLESDFSFYVLNPRGKHVQEAAEFILSYENTGTFPDDSAAEPMENPRYEKELEEMRGILEDLEYELSQQKDEETQEQLEQMMEQQEENIREYEKEGRWQISPEYLEQCAKLAGNVYICDFNPILSAYEEDPGMFDNLTRERVPELLRNLDSRIRMILFENE